MKRYRLNEKGFTLMELLVTMMIAGILATIAFVSLDDAMEGYKKKGATRQIYGDLQMARLSAVKQGNEWAVCFDPGDPFTSYRLSEDDGSDDTWCNTDDTYYKTVDIAGEYGGLTFNQNFGGDHAEFNPNGSGSGGRVTVTDSSGASFEVVVTSTTGSIRID